VRGGPCRLGGLGVSSVPKLCRPLLLLRQPPRPPQPKRPNTKLPWRN
jgi:hypothetical protein